MLMIYAVILACTMPPAVVKDTPDYRLQQYAKNPTIEFCYNWHPDAKLMRERRWAAKLAREVAKDLLGE